MISFARTVLQSSMWICSIFFLLVTGAIATEPTYEQEKTIYIKTGAEVPGTQLQYGNLGLFKNQRHSHAIILYREDT